jgi:hypothetical protein
LIGRAGLLVSGEALPGLGRMRVDQTPCAMSAEELDKLIDESDRGRLY